MFKEKHNLHDMNRRLSKESKIAPAQLSDGTQGVVYYYGDRLLVLSRAEAISAATRLVEALETTPPISERTAHVQEARPIS